MSKIKSKLGFGPMSSESIEAVFRYSEINDRELMLIASKNQIDYNKGYVNNWDTKQFMKFIKEMKEKYPRSSVKICRDHCGPGFNGSYELEDTYRTIKEDIEQGFDLMHIDFCHLNGSKEEILAESKKAIEYCLKINPEITLEIGTDDNTGKEHSMQSLEDIEKEINFFKEFCDPEFFVVQTGSLVKEISQVGKFNDGFVRRLSEILHSKKVKLKEHNADYLQSDELNLRKNVVDALNIAPQLGSVQTSTVLNKCLKYGIKYDAFLKRVYEGGKWKKWLQSSSPENKELCFLIAGHYHFSSEEYKKIISELEKKEDIKEEIIKSITEVVKHYDF